MSFDQHANFAVTTIVTPPSSAGTTFTIVSADAVLFPAVPFNATIWPATVAPLVSNAEIVRVTALNNITGSVTATRYQEGTAGIVVSAGYKFANNVTDKMFTDIESFISNTATYQTVSFEQDTIVLHNQYVAGRYRFPGNVKLHVAEIVCKLSPANGYATLVAEINGVEATGYPVPLSSGVVGEQNFEIDLNNSVVSAGAFLRWKLVTTPGSALPVSNSDYPGQIFITQNLNVY